MTRPSKLAPPALDAWITRNPGWTRTSADGITKTYRFPDFSSGLGFVVRIGCTAEKQDHHPDVALAWGKVELTFSTHDAGGVTELDLKAAEAADAIAP